MCCLLIEYGDSDCIRLPYNYVCTALLQTDLNGDGKPEIITATPGGRLHILAPRRFGDGFAKAEVKGGTCYCCQRYG